MSYSQSNHTFKAVLVLTKTLAIPEGERHQPITTPANRCMKLHFPFQSLKLRSNSARIETQVSYTPSSLMFSLSHALCLSTDSP